MEKKEIKKKIKDALFSIKSSKEKNHPLRTYKAEDMKDLKEKFKTNNCYLDTPSYEIYAITNYLQEEEIIDFVAEEKGNLTESWFEIIVWETIGQKEDGQFVAKPIIWDGCEHFSDLEGIDDFIERLVEIQEEINKTKFFNSFNN